LGARFFREYFRTFSKSLALSEISDFVGEVKGVLLYPRNPTTEAQSFMDIVSERISLQKDWKAN
jgi:hypothetical protein